MKNFDVLFKKSLNFILRTLFESYDRLVHLSHYINEIVAAIDFIGGLYYFKKYNASQVEYTFGIQRSGKAINFVLQAAFTSLFSYFLNKLELKAQSSKKHYILHKAIQSLETILQLTYLLGVKNNNYPSLEYFILRQGIKIVGDYQVESAWKFFIVFIIHKFFHYFFNQYEKQSHSRNEQKTELRAPYQQDTISNPICQICRKSVDSAATIGTSGYLFCLSCIYNQVQRYGKCPITQNPTSTQQIRRVYF